MNHPHPRTWLELSARERDILVLLDTLETANGAELYRTNGKGVVPGRSSKPPHYEALDELVNRGLVERETGDGPEKIYRVTGVGMKVIDKAKENMEG